MKGASSSSSSSSSSVMTLRNAVIFAIGALFSICVIILAKELTRFQQDATGNGLTNGYDEETPATSPSSSTSSNSGVGDKPPSLPHIPRLQNQQQQSSSSSSSSRQESSSGNNQNNNNNNPKRSSSAFAPNDAQIPEEMRRNAGNRFYRPPASDHVPHGLSYDQEKAFRDMKREEDEMKRGATYMKIPSEPTKCRRNSIAMEDSTDLIRKYGTVAQGGWCELETLPSSQLSGLDPSDIEFRSAAFDTVMRSNNDTTPIPNGSTYFDYRASSNGKDWPYYQCPVKHNVRCQTNRLRQEEAKGGRKLMKSKALVIFVLSPAERSLQRHHETSNLLYFLEHALIPANTPTALFDDVDYIFAKIQLGGESTDAQFVDCGSFEEAQLIKEKVRIHHPQRNSDSVRAPNVRFMMVPKSSCDICAHARILSHLGIYDMKVENERVLEVARSANTGSTVHDAGLLFRDDKWDNLQPMNLSTNPYSHVYMLNSGTRGPFFVNDDDFVTNRNTNNKNENKEPKTTWLDYIAMAGRQKIPNPRLGFFHHPIARKKDHVEKEMIDGKPRPIVSQDHDECPIHIASAVSISWEQKMHLQTYFVAAPIELMRTRLFSLFANSCNGDKVYCIMKGEVESARMVIDYSSITAVYSLGRQFHARDTAGPESRVRKDKYFVPAKNPCYLWNDMCKAVLIKNGGHLAHDGNPLKRILVDAIDRLTKGVSMKGQSAATARFEYSDWMGIQRMFDEKKCQWDF